MALINGFRLCKFTFELDVLLFLQFTIQSSFHTCREIQKKDKMVGLRLGLTVHYMNTQPINNFHVPVEQ